MVPLVHLGGSDDAFGSSGLGGGDGEAGGGLMGALKKWKRGVKGE